jgi:hypothetical protein
LEAQVAWAEQRDAEPAQRERLLGQLEAAHAAIERARSPELPSVKLAGRLTLEPLDEALLWAAVALERDPVFATTVTALAGEEPRHGVSARLLAQVLRLGGEQALALRLDAQHPLVEAGLLETSAPAGTPESLKPWRVSPRAVAYLAGDDTRVDALIARLGGVVPLPEGADFQHAAEACALLHRVLATGEDVIVCIEGSDGAGRRTLVASAAREVGRQAVSVDAGRLSAERPRFLAELRALRRECWLRGAIPVVARLDALIRRDPQRERLVDIAEALESPGAVHGPAVLTVASGTDLPDFERRVVRVRLDAPGRAASGRIWARALGVPELTPALADAVQLYALTPGGIERAAANARLLATGKTLDGAAVRAGVAAEIQERFSGLAQRVAVTQSWDDLVLPSDTLDDVKSFAARAAHAGLVYDQWGFRDKLGRGLGLSALFSGPPGTGKTMVAGLIAQSLGLELYMVDLSQVVSKWVGETEKQLGKIFDAAAMGHVVLLFDEADSLFAKRTEVKSSNDRYANLEVNYLLQRIEAFGGVAILTTNLEGSVDPAFKRRLAAEVRFYPPERDERERLWRTLLPARAPAADGLDFGVLADRYKDMCGGHIRNAVLRAAFLAASESTKITQDQLARAGAVEYRAMGKVL